MPIIETSDYLCALLTFIPLFYGIPTVLIRFPSVFISFLSVGIRVLIPYFRAIFLTATCLPPRVTSTITLPWMAVRTCSFSAFAFF